MSSTHEAAKLLSTPPSELKDKPPAQEESEAQEEQVIEQEATPETTDAKRETPEPEGERDTEAELRKFKVKVDGEELEVDEEELKKGYSRESHYQKKAKDLAKERESLQAKAQEIDKYLEEAKSIVEGEQAKLNSEEMADLKENDPERYLKEVDRINAKIAKYQEVKSQRQKEQQEKEAQILAKEREALFDAFPEWKDDESIMQKESGEMMKALGELGFSDDELNNITDHRMFVLARRLVEFNKIQSVDLEAKKEKPQERSVKPGANNKESQESNKVKEARKRFNKTRSWKDAAQLLAT